MKKLSLAALALVFKAVVVIGQTAPTDTTAYTDRKLHVDEINLVSSYYIQNGDNSAVTGGVGTEHLTDFANTLDIKLVRHGKNRLQHSFNFELGIDAYTSASSDKIDPSTVSSASSSDTRIYPSLNWTVKNEQKGLSAGITGSFSTEYDYKSYGLGLNFAKNSLDNNRELSLKLQAYWDTWKVILPIELRTHGEKEEGYSPRNSYSASLSYSQVINTRLQATVLVDGIYQEGLLATKYQRVYFQDNSEQSEVLPDKRFKLPFGVRLNYFAGSRFILRGYYRYYMDDWGVKAHTISLEVPVKINPYLSASPFYRYYTQTAADYFAPINQHITTDNYFTSDYDLSAFSSNFVGLNVRYLPEKGVLGIRQWKMAELRYGHYIRSNGLTSDVFTLNVQFK